MRSILLLIAVMAIAVPAHSALEPGDLVVSGAIVQPYPTPSTPGIFYVKPNGTIETLVLGGDLFMDSFYYSTNYFTDSQIAL